MWFVRACIALVVLWHARAQSAPDQTLLSPRPARVRDRDVGKPDEPSCDQLKAMWRFSKRQAKAPEIMNEMNSFHDPMHYNEWPVFAAIPRAAPRFRYQYTSVPQAAYGRVVTKAPPNVVRSPDYEEMFGMLNVPRASGKILRYPGPSSRVRSGPTYLVPPQRNRFETLKKLIRQEHVMEQQRRYETEQKHGLKEVTAGRPNPGDEGLAFGYPQTDSRGMLAEYNPEDPNNGRPNKKPGSNRQVAQFSRYSEPMMPPPSRRSYFHPYFEYQLPEYIPYLY